jgi:hypothetical protein
MCCDEKFRDDNLVGWYNHINCQKQNTTEFQQFMVMGSERNRFMFLCSFVVLQVMSMLEFLWSTVLGLFMASFMGEHCVVCCLCVDFSCWTLIKSNKRLEFKYQGPRQYEAAKYYELLFLLWFNSSCFSWSLLGGDGMNA